MYFVVKQQSITHDTIVQFQDDTARIIYAYRDEDPEDENDFRWHGTEGRGVKFLYLLNAVTKPDLSGSIMTRDMLQTNVSTNIDKKNNKNNNKKTSTGILSLFGNYSCIC